MLKTIKFIFILFSGISLIVIASVFVGFKIDSISYKNIHIEKLYLKYDKKLHIETPKITITNLKSNKTREVRLNFNIDYKNDLFVLDIKNFTLIGTDIKFKGLVYIDTNKINLDKKSELIVENANIVFDKKMENIKAKRIFISYENNNIDFTLEKPYYGTVDIKDSKVSFLLDKNILKLYLKTTSILNDTLKNALLRYGVEIPLLQHTGKNKIFAKVFIPLGEGKLFIESDVRIKNAKLEVYGEKFEISTLLLKFKDNVLKGEIHLKNYNYNDIYIKNSLLKYNVSFNKGIQASMYSKRINVRKEKDIFLLDDMVVNFKNNKINFSSKIKDNQNKLSLNFINTTNLNTKKFKGDIKLNYQDLDNNISLNSDEILYDGDFNKKFLLKITTDTINITKPQTLKIKDLAISFKDNIVNTVLSLKDTQKTYNLNISNTTNFDDQTSYGNINASKLQYKNLVNIHNKNISYDISFEDNITINLPLFGLTYFKAKHNTEHKLIISNPNKLLESFTFIKTNNKSNGFIDIRSQDLNNTIIRINNLNFDLNSSYFKSNENEKPKRLVLPLFPKIKLSYINSKIKYNDFTLDFDTIDLNTEKNILQLKIQKDKAILDLQTKNNSIIFQAKYLDDKYINNLLNKEILKDGYIDFNVYGDDINLLSGDINFYKTTVKNVTIVNSLLTFINTTPAIFNPLLALPTLFRLAETGFDTNGYYLKYGNGSFRYNLPNQELNIYDLYTNGKMSNFIVNSQLNLKTKKVKANVDISFLKDFSKVIRYIPLVGYIVMGEDGEFHTSVDISGTTENPILETHSLKEATNGVTGILERILTLPLQPFKGETTKEQKKAHKKRVQELLN